MTRTKKSAICVAGITLAISVLALVLPRVLFGDGVDYSRAASIEGTLEYQDQRLLQRAFSLPVASRYLSSFDYQRNGSFCGPTSLVNVKRSLGESADQSTILEHTQTRTVFGRLIGGVTLDELATLARDKLKRNVTVLRDLDLATFRSHLRRANDPATRYIANFHRGPIFARGGGHHSPIIAYLEDVDLVLVLDVNESYRPWLVSPARLYEAINTVDRATGNKRGLLLIE